MNKHSRNTICDRHYFLGTEANVLLRIFYYNAPGVFFDYRSGTIVIDFRHRFTVINMNDTPVPIGQIHSFHSYVNTFISFICITVIA